MMKSIVKFYENCIRVITDSSKSGAGGKNKISMGLIEQSLGGDGDVISQLSKMKFQHPDMREEEMRIYFDDFHEKIDSRFRDLQFF